MFKIHALSGLKLKVFFISVYLRPLRIKQAPWSGRRYGVSTAGGFSLLELLVVVIIITVLLGLVVPGLGGARSRGLADVAERLSMIINHARQEAVLTSSVWLLEIDPVENIYRFRQRPEFEFKQVVRAPFAETRLQPDISFNELEINGLSALETGQVYLFPTGEQDTFRLILQSGDSRQSIAMGPLGPARAQVP